MCSGSLTATAGTSATISAAFTAASSFTVVHNKYVAVFASFTTTGTLTARILLPAPADTTETPFVVSGPDGVMFTVEGPDSVTFTVTGPDGATFDVAGPDSFARVGGGLYPDAGIYTDNGTYMEAGYIVAVGATFTVDGPAGAPSKIVGPERLQLINA
jgi:hypothetical protein